MLPSFGNKSNFCDRCDQTLTDYLSDWVSSNEYSLSSRKRSLFALKRLTQLRNFLPYHQDFDAFPIIAPNFKDDLKNWVDFVSDRCLCLKFLQNEGFESGKMVASKVDNFLNLSNEALKRKNYPVAIQLLKVAAKARTLIEQNQELGRKYNRLVTSPQTYSKFVSQGRHKICMFVRTMYNEFGNVFTTYMLT